MSTDLALVEEPGAVEMWLTSALAALPDLDDSAALSELATNASKAARALKVLDAARELRSQAIELELHAYRRLGHLGMIRESTLHGVQRRACTYAAACTAEQFDEVLELRHSFDTGAACTLAHYRMRTAKQRKRTAETFPHSRLRGFEFIPSLICRDCGWSECEMDVRKLTTHVKTKHDRQVTASDRTPVALSTNGRDVLLPLAGWIEQCGGKMR